MSGSYAPCLRLVTLVACTTDPPPGELISATIRYDTTTSSHTSASCMTYPAPSPNASEPQNHGGGEIGREVVHGEKLWEQLDYMLDGYRAKAYMTRYTKRGHSKTSDDVDSQFQPTVPL